MGLWQNLCEAYTANGDLLRKNYPLSTTTVNNSTKPLLVVSIDAEGTFKSVRLIPKKAKSEPLNVFVIPVTEASLNRTGPCPNPLFDQYAYLKGEGNKFELYLAELAKRKDLSREFNAVYLYLSKRTLAQDIDRLAPKEVKPALKDDSYVLFEVELPGETNPRLWENETLMECWHNYYKGMCEKAASKEQELAGAVKDEEREIAQLESEKAHCKDKTRKKELQTLIKDKKNKKGLVAKELKEAMDGTVFCQDMISGNRAISAISHPKKIVNAAGNAKLISDNDKENFTYRGRFSTSREAFAVSYDSSQRAHQFLRYIACERGIKCDSQVIVTFTIPQSKEDSYLPQPPVSDSDDLWSEMPELPSVDANVGLASGTGFDFSNALRKAIEGYRIDPVLRAGRHAPTMIVILDAATTGRLSITFYREMTREDYLKKLQDWHDTCRWQFIRIIKDEKGNKIDAIKYTGAPSIDAIITCVYGSARGKDTGYNKMKKRARETMVRCIFDNSSFPRNFLIQAVRRASAPLANSVINSKFNRSAFMQNISVACALVNKSLKDEGKEPYGMSIEQERNDRDYLYGRLLAAADKLEEYALFKKGNKRQETAAIRYMQIFSQKPYSTWNTIHQTLVPYIQQVKNSLAFSELQQIHGKFQEGDFENDAPLSGAYLLGYYCERAYIEQKVSEISNKNNDKTEESK